ncbi:hypothetical protein V8E51_014100 [Hyaloscypha variabilis]
MNVTSVYNYCPSIATYSFSLTCTGSSDCQALTSFPDVTCITTGTTTSCSNGVACSAAESNYTSISSLAQDPSGDLIEYNELFLSDYCEKSWFSVNGSNIGPLYTSNSCSNGTAGTNTTTLAGIPTGAPNSLSNVSSTSCGGGTGLPTPPRPSSSSSPIIQTQTCNYAYSKILQIPDLATELCPEIETSVLVHQALRLHALLMIRVMASAQTCKGTRSTAELAGSSAMKESVPVEFVSVSKAGPTATGLVPIFQSMVRIVDSVVLPVY